MMSVQTSVRTLGNLPIPPSDSDLANSSYKISTINAIPQVVNPDMVMSGPLPLPRFVFPAKDSFTLSKTILKIPEKTSRRPYSVDVPRSNYPLNSQDHTCKKTLSPSHPVDHLDSPPLSPRTSLVRSGIYKRGICEDYDGIKSTSTVSLPCNLPLGNDAPVSSSPAILGRRRGHAHRRSAAISCGDLSIILQPRPPRQAGGSLPNSPNLDPKSSLNLHKTSTEMEPGSSPDSNQLTKTLIKTPKNIRVGFSDDVQIIPRPLSLASYDSASTVRPGHSVSDSITSIVSGSKNSSYHEEENSKVISANELKRTTEPICVIQDSRSTSLGSERSGSLPALFNTIMGSGSDPSTPRSLRRWSFFHNDVASESSTPKTSPTSTEFFQYDHRGQEGDKITGSQCKQNYITNHETTVTRRLSTHQKPDKKNQRRVKLWAGSMLTHRSRQRSHKRKPSRNTLPTPRLTIAPPITGSSENENGRSDSFTIGNETAYVNWKPKTLPPQEEPISPVIDLDAALGPFNTPTSDFGEFWENSQRGSTRKKAMHSAAGLGGFSGPGMHYHRRAESAPEFENPRFGYHRIGSSSTMTMEDVFEEDEDEECEDARASEKDLNSIHEVFEDKNELKIESVTDKVPAHSAEALSTDVSSSINSLYSNDETTGFKMKNTANEPTTLNDSQADQKSPVHILSSNGCISRQTSVTHLPSSTSIEWTQKDVKNNDESPLKILKLPVDVTGSSQSSRHSSYIPPGSPLSFDTQLISTAPSSIKNELEFELLLLGEPGPTLRISVDDMPSLTSSDSISCNSLAAGDNLTEIVHKPRPRDCQRSASFSATIVNRKRSSIASLSRLINSSHGERSKLAIESRAPSYSEVECSQKAGNLGKRISRMMKFWKKQDI